MSDSTNISPSGGPPVARRIDLHTHSTASDGRWTQQQIVSHAARIGLKALALTDQPRTVWLMLPSVSLKR